MKPEEMTVCPHCGEEIRRSAKACPHCGSDDRTGWSQETYLDGIDLPDDDSYEEIRRNEFGGSGPPAAKKKVWIYVTAAIILALFLIGIAASLR